jgi:hypothetical protein
VLFTGDQLSAAAVLIELNGLARRMVLRSPSQSDMTTARKLARDG